MTVFLWNNGILADAAAAQGADAPTGSPILQLMIMFVPIAVLFYFMILKPEKKKQQDLRSMIQNLKENDRVLTIGGIYGVVTNVQRDAERLTIRVDEATGTKLRVNMSAIARVLTADQDGGSEGKT